MLLPASQGPNNVKFSIASFRNFTSTKLPSCGDFQEAIRSISYILKILNNKIQYLTFLIQYFFTFDISIWYRNEYPDHLFSFERSKDLLQACLVEAYSVKLWAPWENQATSGRAKETPYPYPYPYQETWAETITKPKIFIYAQ